MQLKIFSIRDQKAEVFHSPFYKKTHGEAERDFRTAVADEKTALHQFPEDFDLYYLGEYDDNTGVFKTVDTPQHIIKAISVAPHRVQPATVPDISPKKRKK